MQEWGTHNRHNTHCVNWATHRLVKCDNQKGFQYDSLAIVVILVYIFVFVFIVVVCSEKNRSAYMPKRMRYVFIDWSLFDSGLDQPLMNICMYAALCLCVPACLTACVFSLLQSVICYIWLLLFCDIWFWRWMDFDALKKGRRYAHTHTKLCQRKGRKTKWNEKFYTISPGRYFFFKFFFGIVQ